LAPRSRKRGQRRKPAEAAAGRTAAAAPVGPAPRRSAEERNAAVRAELVPLAPGERPWSIRISALLALIVGVGDLVDVLVSGSHSFGGTHASVGGVILFSFVMIICAMGMWRMRYWAVLGFQAVLAIVILIFALLLIRASNLLGFIVPIVIIGGGGVLFFKLVRVLSRLQMPPPSTR
jgi:hypothetical protein